MKSKITSKYQVTIPRQVRDALNLSKSDALEWRVSEDRITVWPAKKPFLAFRGKVTVGKGSVKKDIEAARMAIGRKHA